MAQNLPQLYRFCVLMTGDPAKAQEVFHDTLRDAALQAANGEPPPDRYWFFREARWRCLAATEKNVQPETNNCSVAELSEHGPEQIARIDSESLAGWISAAPEPQRSALALFYLDEFTHREIRSMLALKLSELSRALALGRREFQAWLNTTAPIEAR